MKQLILRCGGVILFATAVVACSGVNQTVTPSAGLTSPQQQMAIDATSGSHPTVLQITAKDRAMARSLKQIGRPHITYTRMHNKAAGIRPDSGYPLDMSCQTRKCPVMNASTAYDIFVTPDGKKCATEKCWGNPNDFLKALTGSPLVGLVQQYTKGAPTGYKFGGSTAVQYHLAYTNTFYFNDLLTILSAAAHHFKAVGLNVEYHLFLPPGIDTCFDQTNICYSPDNLSSFFFCAYHTAVLSSAGPIVFSVEPWQAATVDIGGQKFYACTIPVKGFNILNSATASTLSHESFESWSDPLPNTGWFNTQYGQEIGDVCAYHFEDVFASKGKQWFIQDEYSNSFHGCDNKP